MELNAIIAALDDEIVRLQQARNLLSGGGNVIPSPFIATDHRHRSMSAEARARISAAQKRRWAKVKKAEK